MNNEHTLTSSAGSERGASPQREPESSEQLDLLKLPNTLAQSSSVTGPMSQTTGTSEKSRLRKQGLQTSAPHPHPVSPIQSQIFNEATNQITAYSGESCLQLLKTSGPVGSLVRKLVSSPTFISTIFSLRWKPLATKQGRLYFQLVPTEIAPTEGTDCGSSRTWPTPTTRDYKDTGNLENVPEKGLLGRVFQNTFGTRLQPEFSEWLMGLPIGHTVLNGFKQSATQSPPPSPTKS
tara:strand:- start:383 stop:1087 length:705 start_codon:yes stop_codon:yes gene_type:complete